tara:strand:+ start:115 stop:867 length:753 start_codon:yes stop_codon:yes gene_type:complete
MVVQDEKVRTYAKLSEGSYEMGDKAKSREERIASANKQIAGTGFSVVDDKRYTNPNMTTYKNEETGEINVSHRGTNVGGRKGMKDIRNDFAIALGLQKLDPRFRRRTKNTERVIKDLKPEKFTMAGHSLGGGTVKYAIANSRTIRKNLHSAETFNSAANPILNNDLQVSKKDKKELEDKVTHHRIKGDIVSIGFNASVPFGKVKKYSVKHDEESGKGLVNKIVKKSSVLSKVKQLTSKALHAHKIEHFHQ